MNTTNTPTQPAAPGRPAVKEPTWRVVACFVLTLVAIQLVAGPKIRLSQWQVEADSNAAVAEGTAWLKGRLDLPPMRHDRLDWSYAPSEGFAERPDSRLHDTACSPDGAKCFNVFPPLMAFLTVALAPLHGLVRHPEGMWLPQAFVLLIFWPLPIVGFIVFYRRTRDSAWAGLLTLAWIAGTAVLPNLHEARTGLLGQIHHVVSQVGLLIFAADMLGRRRIWPSIIGIAIATYTRQITFLYGLPLLWVAWQRGRRDVVLALLGLAAVASPLLILNHLKFGNPLEFGYHRIYVGRETDYMGARCIQYGTFNPRFVWGVDGGHGNFYYLHLAPPRVELSLTEIKISDNNQNGQSIWLTNPLLLLVLLGARQWWSDKKSRILMLGTLPVMLGVLCYHSPGYMEHGYSRFALDFMPIWLLVIAPQTKGRLRTWFTLACTAWSLLYFQAIVPDGPVRPGVSRLSTMAVERGV